MSGPLVRGVAPVVHGALALDAPLSTSVVTLGTFDGVHRGHQELIGRAVGIARARKVEAIAYTFDPHPAKILAPKVAPLTISAIRERVRLMRQLGVDRVIVEPFDRAFSELSADAWVERWLVGQLHPIHVVVGFNFSYGKGRGGTPEHLARAGERFGFGVDVVEAVGHASAVVSSTRVRERLLAGDVEGAARLLGRPAALTGEVVRGDERGRTIGFPTANLAEEAELVPANGVYVSQVILEPSDDPAISASEVAHPAVTNIGLRPTFSGTRISIETHLLDFSGDLYGKRVRVELLQRLREEKKFDGIDALVAQIRRDADEARRVHEVLRGAAQAGG